MTNSTCIKLTGKAKPVKVKQEKNHIILVVRGYMSECKYQETGLGPGNWIMIWKLRLKVHVKQDCT